MGQGEQTDQTSWLPRCSQWVPAKSGKGENAQVRAHTCRVCKTVGSAYVGSNPTPATRKSPGQPWRERSSSVFGVSGLQTAPPRGSGSGLGRSVPCRCPARPVCGRFRSRRVPSPAQAVSHTARPQKGDHLHQRPPRFPRPHVPVRPGASTTWRHGGRRLAKDIAGLVGAAVGCGPVNSARLTAGMPRRAARRSRAATRHHARPPSADILIRPVSPQGMTRATDLSSSQATIETATHPGRRPRHGV